MRRGKLFYISRFLVRLWIGRWTVDVPLPTKPTVFICSHHNMRGPLATLCWLPFFVRHWSLYIFFDKGICRKHYKEYTFSWRFGLPKPLAAALARMVSGYVSALMHSMDAIPVYRGTTRIGSTFKESISALCAGDSILIFPDVDYVDESDGIGEIYDGFLLLERFWRRKSDEPLSFVPLRLDIDSRCITAGNSVQFARDAEWEFEKNRVKEAIRSAINEQNQ